MVGENKNDPHMKVIPRQLGTEQKIGIAHVSWCSCWKSQEQRWSASIQALQRNTDMEVLHCWCRSTTCYLKVLQCQVNGLCQMHLYKYLQRPRAAPLRGAPRSVQIPLYK